MRIKLVFEINEDIVKVSPRYHIELAMTRKDKVIVQLCVPVSSRFLKTKSLASLQATDYISQLKKKKKKQNKPRNQTQK